MNFSELRSSKIWGWAIYDFANTIYSAVVVTVYLPLYVTELAGKNTPVGVAATASMIASGLIVPLLGAWLDRTGKAKRYLLIATLICILATASISFSGAIPIILFVFFLANVGFHSAMVFYNALLPSVAPEKSQGFVSGLGTGLGYLGVLCALPMARWVEASYGQVYVFLVAAVLFGLFSIPVFFLVPDTEKTSYERFNPLQSFQNILSDKNVLFFFIGNFFLVDALNAAILWLSVFLKKTYGISGGDLITTILLLNFSAAVFGILLGKMTDWFGSKSMVLLSAISLGGAVCILAMVSTFESARIFLVLLGGIAVAGTWTAGRKLLIDLAPFYRLGEYFGIYGLTTKVSAFGSLILAILADYFGFRVAILSQLIPIFLALVFISQVQIPAKKS